MGLTPYFVLSNTSVEGCFAGPFTISVCSHCSPKDLEFQDLVVAYNPDLQAGWDRNVSFLKGQLNKHRCLIRVQACSFIPTSFSRFLLVAPQYTAVVAQAVVNELNRKHKAGEIGEEEMEAIQFMPPCSQHSQC